LFSWWSRVMTISLNFRPIVRYSPASQIRRFWSEISPKMFSVLDFLFLKIRYSNSGLSSDHIAN
jgi:hypothetical protein